MRCLRRHKTLHRIGNLHALKIPARRAESFAEPEAPDANDGDTSPAIVRICNLWKFQWLREPERYRVNQLNFPGMR